MDTINDSAIASEVILFHEGQPIPINSEAAPKPPGIPCTVFHPACAATAKIPRDTVNAKVPKTELAKKIKQLETEMMTHAKNLEFERAALLRDELQKLREEAFKHEQNQ